MKAWRVMQRQGRSAIAHDDRPVRIAAVAGLTFGILSITGIATIGQFPHAGDPPALVVRFFTQHRNAVLTTTMLLSLGNGAHLVFFGYLRSVLHRPRADSPQADSPLPTLAFGAPVLLCAIGAAAEVLPKWLGALSGLIAVAELGATFTLRGAGTFFSPGGTYGTGVLFGSLTMWVLVVSLVLLTRGATSSNSPLSPRSEGWRVSDTRATRPAA